VPAGEIIEKIVQKSNGMWVSFCPDNCQLSPDNLVLGFA
jgi:hypothetical protein